MPPTISLAVMVKDDAKRLDRCLASLKGAVEEIVVLDTGSRDGSVDVARGHGADVSVIEWPGNFSVALNQLLARIETDWTLRLDSDEWMDPDQAAKLRAAIGYNLAGVRLIRRDLRDDGRYDEIHLMRLWKTHPEMRYEGVVHEVIPETAIKAAWPGAAVAPSDIFFWHDGYAREGTDKLRRNADLLLKELEKRPGDQHYEAVLATTLHALGDPSAPLHLKRVADRFLANDSAPESAHVGMALAMHLETVPAAEVRDKRADKLLALSVKWFPRTPGVLYNAALLEKERGNLPEALRLLLILEELIDSGSYDRSTPTPAELLGERFCNALGFVAMQLGRTDVMARCQRRMSR